MLWGCRECFPRHQLQRKPLVSDPGMYHGTCVTHVPWCMSASLTRCAFPAHAQPAILCIWWEAHGTARFMARLVPAVHYSQTHFLALRQSARDSCQASMLLFTLYNLPMILTISVLYIYYRSSLQAVQERIKTHLIKHSISYILIFKAPYHDPIVEEFL